MKFGILWNSVLNYNLKDNAVNEHILPSLFGRFGEFIGDHDEDDLHIIVEPDTIIDQSGKITNAWQFNQYSAIFILAELTWHHHKFTDFYGITLAKRLRIHNVSCAVIICSFLPEYFFLKSYHNKILEFRGHSFLQVPNMRKIDNLQFNALTPMELLDCKMHFCDLEGAIRDIYHHKQRILSLSDYEQAKMQLLKIFKDIQSLALPTNLSNKLEAIISEINKINTIDEIKRFCRTDESSILAFLEKGDIDKTDFYEVVVKGDWNILLLEDELDDIRSLLEQLKSFGFLENNILIASSVEEAKKHIESDHKNRIAVVISDYRLKLREKQGYIFIEWLSKQDRYVETYVFSGLSRKFLIETFKKFNLRISVLSKYDTERMREFVEEVITKGNEVTEIIASAPNAESWRELKSVYQEYRLWSGYQQMEKEISDTARRIILQIKSIRSTIKANDQDDKIVSYGIEPLQNLTSKLFKEIKGNAYELNALDESKGQYVRLIKIGEKEKYLLFESILNNKDYLEKFKNKLIARRVALWLQHIEGIHINTIYSLLMKGEYVNNYFIKPENYDKWMLSDRSPIPETPDAKTLIYTRLALIREDFPGRILVEEKNWLKYEMNVDLNDLTSIICGFENYFSKKFESFQVKMDKKRTAFKELRKNYILNNRFFFHTANDIRKALKLALRCINSPATQRDLIQGILECYDPNDIIGQRYFAKLKKYCERQLIRLRNR